MLQRITDGHWPIFLLSSLSSFGNLFLPILLVRLISPTDMGIYKIFFLHLSAIPFLFLTGGPINSIYYFIGKKEKAQYLQATWQVSTLLSLLIIIIGVPLSGIITHWLSIQWEYVIMMLFTAFFWVPAGHFSESQIANGKTFIGSLYDTLFQFIKVISFIAIAWYTKDLSYIFFFYLILLTFKFILTFILGHKNNTISLKFNKKHLKQVFQYCLPISLSGCFGFFVDKIDMLILSGNLSSKSFAYYSMGCLIIPPLYLLEMSVQKVLIPKLSRAYQDQNGPQAIVHFRKAIKDIAFLIIPATFGLVYFAKPIIVLLYTEQYLSSVIYLKIFALSHLLLLIPHDAVPRATGRSKWILKIYLLTTPISLSAVFLAAKYSDAKNTLITALLIKILPKIFGLIYSKKLMNWKWKEMFPSKELIIFTSISSILTIGSNLCRFLFKNDVHWFLFSSSLFAIIYLGILIPYKKADS